MRTKEEKRTNWKIHYLSRINYLQGLIESKNNTLKTIEYRKSQVKAIDYAKEQIKGGNKSSWEALIDKTDECKEYIIQKNIELHDSILEIMKVIDNVKNDEYRLLLSMRYIECKKWDEIETRLDISTNTRVNKHTAALKYIHLPRTQQ
nr:MAG TPA: Protein of unknown function (DUF1492) [Caudoviricetes sp.]